MPGKFKTEKKLNCNTCIYSIVQACKSSNTGMIYGIPENSKENTLYDHYNKDLKSNLQESENSKENTLQQEPEIKPTRILQSNSGLSGKPKRSNNKT